MLANQGRVVGNMGPEAIRTQTVGSYVNLAEQMGLDTDTSTLTGLMSSVGGMSIADARLMVEASASDPNIQLGQTIQGHLKGIQDLQDENAYGPAGFVRGAWGATKQAA